MRQDAPYEEEERKKMANLVDAVFDVRTGYHVITKPAGWFEKHPLGEGNPDLFTIIRCWEDELPEFWEWRETKDILTGIPVVERVPLLKLDVQKHTMFRVEAKAADTALKNVYTKDALELAIASQEEFLTETAKYDTRKNAVLTVGTGKTYATISAAVTAASSGDTIAVYANATNTYTENVDASSKLLQIIGMVPNRGVTITAASGTVVKFSVSFNSGGSYFENFKVVATGTAGIGVDAWYAAYALVIRDIEAVGGTTAAIRGYISTKLINCLARDAAVGFWTDQLVTFLNCTAVDNTTYGFQGGNNAHCIMCIGAGNGTADFYQIGSRTYLNASADGSAPGAGSVTGFLTSDFVDYAGDDFRLKSSVKDTTKAKFDGYPRYPYDGFGQGKKTGGVIYAGWFDPDPLVATKPSAPTITGASPGDGLVALHITAAAELDVIYARYRTTGPSPGWSAESETFKRTGSGDIVITGLANGAIYEFAVYAKTGDLTSDWSAPVIAKPEGTGPGTAWTGVLSKSDAYWEGIL